MIRRSRLCFWVLVVSLLSLCWTTPVAAHKIGKGYNNGPIWEIKTETNTVYLLGSIHALNTAYYPLTRGFYYAYYSSPNIVFEVDLNQVLSGKKSKLLKRKRTFATSRVSQNALLMKLDFEGKFGVDRHFYWKAKAVGKHIHGLESVEYQMSVLDNIILKSQKVMAGNNRKNAKQASQRLTRLVEAWHKGDEATLGRMIDEEKSSPEVYQAVYYDRNMKWLPQIESFMGQEENYLVIVGVGHLVGEDGLVKLLVDKGHTVRRMVYALP